MGTRDATNLAKETLLVSCPFEFRMIEQSVFVLKLPEYSALGLVKHRDGEPCVLHRLLWYYSQHYSSKWRKTISTLFLNVAIRQGQ
jgi:hypothetical protein